MSPSQVTRHWSSSEVAASCEAWGCWWIFDSVSLKRPGNEFSWHVACWFSHTRTSHMLLPCSLLPHGQPGEWWQIVNGKKDTWQAKKKYSLIFTQVTEAKKLWVSEVLPQKRFGHDIRKRNQLNRLKATWKWHLRVYFFYLYFLKKLYLWHLALDLYFKTWEW